MDERAGIQTKPERDDLIVYTLYTSPCYATVVGCTGFTGERLQQVVAVAPVYRNRSGFLLGPVVL